VKFKLRPLLPIVAAWHFNLLSTIGKPFNALIALSEEFGS
jgi:hypothetical protein